MNSVGSHTGFDVTEFLQSLQSQLDRAQDSLAIKVRTGRPLTWALKDMSINLRAFAEVDAKGNMRLRTAKAGEEGASSFSFSFTTITRPMVEENTLDITQDDDPRSLAELEHAGLIDAETKSDLERVGVRSAGQLKRLNRDVGARAIQAVAGTPYDKLRAALVASSRPVVTGNVVSKDENGNDILLIHGANLTDGLNAEVLLKGEPVEVLKANVHELIVRPLSHHDEGQIEVRVNGDRALGFFSFPAKAHPPVTKPQCASDRNAQE